MEIQIGLPYSFHNVFGRVVGQTGGIVYFATPYGSVMEMGLIHFVMGATQITVDDPQLIYFEEHAVLNGGNWYGGRLPDLTPPIPMPISS